MNVSGSQYDDAGSEMPEPTGVTPAIPIQRRGEASSGGGGATLPVEVQRGGNAYSPSSRGVGGVLEGNGGANNVDAYRPPIYDGAPGMGRRSQGNGRGTQMEPLTMERWMALREQYLGRENTRSGLLGAVGAGVETSVNRLQAAVHGISGNNSGVVNQAAKTARIQHTPETNQFWQQYAQAKNRLGGNTGFFDEAGAMIRTVVDNPTGAAHAVAENVSGMVAEIGMPLAGLAVGNAILPGIGGIIGGAGMALLGNIAGESGGKLIEKAGKGYISDQEMAEGLKEGAVKGIVSTAIDLGTAKLGRVLHGMGQKTLEKTLKNAALSTLEKQGVNIADQAALHAALRNKSMLGMVDRAQRAAVNGLVPLSGRMARSAVELGLDGVGAAAGEYLGELAASGQADAADALLSGILALGYSGAKSILGGDLGKKETRARMDAVLADLHRQTDSRPRLLPQPEAMDRPSDGPDGSSGGGGPLAEEVRLFNQGDEPAQIVPLGLGNVNRTHDGNAHSSSGSRAYDGHAAGTADPLSGRAGEADGGTGARASLNRVEINPGTGSRAGMKRAAPGTEEAALLMTFGSTDWPVYSSLSDLPDGHEGIYSSPQAAELMAQIRTQQSGEPRIAAQVGMNQFVVMALPQLHGRIVNTQFAADGVALAHTEYSGQEWVSVPAGKGRWTAVPAYPSQGVLRNRGGIKQAVPETDEAAFQMTFGTTDWPVYSSLSDLPDGHEGIYSSPQAAKLMAQIRMQQSGEPRIVAQVGMGQFVVMALPQSHGRIVNTRFAADGVALAHTEYSGQEWVSVPAGKGRWTAVPAYPSRGVLKNSRLGGNRVFVPREEASGNVGRLLVAEPRRASIERTVPSDALKDLFGTVRQRMQQAGVVDSPQQMMVYVIDEALRRSGSTRAVVNKALLDRTKQMFGAEVANLTRDFMLLVKASAIKQGISPGAVTVDELLAYARREMQHAGADKTGVMRDEAPRSLPQKKGGEPQEEAAAVKQVAGKAVRRGAGLDYVLHPGASSLVGWQEPGQGAVS